MRKILPILILLQFYLGSCQYKPDCDKILLKEINLKLNNTENLKKFDEDFSLLKSCYLDRGDIEYFSNDVILGELLVSLISKKEAHSKLTYQILYDKILEIKQSDNYEKNKVAIQVSNELSKRPADINNWEKDKLLLQKLPMPNDFIDKFYNYLKEHSNPERTYEIAIANFKTSQKQGPYDGLFKSRGTTDYNELLAQSINIKKPLLLYFTDSACINCRRMEESVLNNIIIDKLKNQFHFTLLYVDDDRELPNDEQFISDKTGRGIKTIGNKNSNLQNEKFNSNSQPYFVIIGNDGEKIKDQLYTRDTEVFMKFLSLEN